MLCVVRLITWGSRGVSIINIYLIIIIHDDLFLRSSIICAH